MCAIERNIRFNKSYYSLNKKDLSSFDDSKKNSRPNQRRRFSCDENIISYKGPKSTLFNQHIQRRKSLKEFNKNLSTKPHVFKSILATNSSSGCMDNIHTILNNQLGNDNDGKRYFKSIDLLNKTTYDKGTIKYSETCLKSKSTQLPQEAKGTIDEWVNEATQNTKEKCRQFLNDKTKEKTISYKHPESYDIKNKFMTLERSYCHLLLKLKSSKSDSFGTSMDLYKLVLRLYRIIQDIIRSRFDTQCGVNKTEFINDISVRISPNENKCELTQSIDTTQSELSSLKSQSNTLHKSTCNILNAEFCGNEIVSNEIENNSLKTVKQHIVNKKPLKIDLDKLKIGELLTFQKVNVKSRSVVRVYQNFVEEHYLISAIRPITEDERTSLHSTESYKDKDNENHYSDLTTITKNIEKSSQTFAQPYTLLSSKARCCKSFSKTKSWNSSVIFPHSNSIGSWSCVDDKSVISYFKSDILCNEDISFSVETVTESISLLENSRKDSMKLSSIIVVCPNFRSEDNSCAFTPNHIEKYSTVTCLYLRSFNINPEIDYIKSLVVTKSRIQTHPYFRQSKSIRPKVLGACTIRFCDTDLGYVEQIASITQRCSLPPRSPSGIVKSCISKETNSEQPNKEPELTLPKVSLLPQSNDVLERIIKLHQVLDDLPKEKLALTLEALDRFDSITSNSLDNDELEDVSKSFVDDINVPTPTSLGDCYGKNKHRNIQAQIPDNHHRRRPFEIKSPNVKGDLDSTNDMLFLDDISETTASLSMLENLIDDFLTKNGIGEFFDI